MIIAIEGIDGSGKGTQAKVVAQILEDLGFKAEKISFPTYRGGLFTKEVEKYLNGVYGNLKEIPPRLISLLYAGDRFENKNFIINRSIENDFLIIDRYVYSNAAHQGVKFTNESDLKEFIIWLEELEFGIYGLPATDLTFLLDIDHQNSQTNVSKKSIRPYTTATHDIHESNKKYLEDVSKLYRQIAIEKSWQVIQCTQDNQMIAVEDISKEIVSFILGNNSA